MRRHLTRAEVQAVIEAAKSVGRYPARDSLMIVIAYRHGLRASELCSLRWSDLDLESAEMFVSRLKNGNPSTHTLAADEVEGLAALRASAKQMTNVYVWVNERGRPVTRQAFHRIVQRAGEIADLGVAAHPHMLRHSAGVHLAAAGTNAFVLRDFLGHKDLTMTSHYCRLAGGRHARASEILT